jgi:hypothetical protein
MVELVIIAARMGLLVTVMGGDLWKETGIAKHSTY